MRYKQFSELERYLNQLRALLINKKDYRDECFNNIKSFYDSQIKTRRKTIIDTFGRQRMDEFDIQNKDISKCA